MVDSVNNTTNSSSAITNSEANSDISKNEFLQLMITQLKYQDPLNPTDSADYSAQLAQYSSLEQLTNLNDKLSELVETNYYLTQSVYNTMSTNLIGKEAKVSTNELVNNGQDDITLGVNLGADPTSVQVKIYNSAGKLVRTIECENFSSGDNKLSWDFTDNNGNELANGTYTFEIEAKGSGNTDITASSFVFGSVDSIRYTDSGTAVVIDGVEYAISEIMEIVEPDDDNDGENTGGK